MEVGYHPIRRILCTTTATPQMPIPLATISASSREVFLQVEVRVFIKDRRTSMLHRTDRLLRPAITCNVLVDGADAISAVLRALPKVRYWEMSGLSPNATRLLSLTHYGPSQHDWLPQPSQRRSEILKILCQRRPMVSETRVPIRLESVHN
jgi:hypothetical protein